MNNLQHLGQACGPPCCVQILGLIQRHREVKMKMGLKHASTDLKMKMMMNNLMMKHLKHPHK